MGTRFKWREQYDDEADAEMRALTDTWATEPSMTDTSKAADADLNNVIARYGITDGSLRPQAADPRYYGDFSDAQDFRGIWDQHKEAAERFAALPADVRKKFDFDPVKLHDWVTDPRNGEEAVQLGLLAKKPPHIPDEVRTRRDVVEWAARPENAAEAGRLGLLPKAPEAPKTP